MIDYKQSKAPHTTITRDMNNLTEKVGNVYETSAPPANHNVRTAGYERYVDIGGVKVDNVLILFVVLKHYFFSNSF